MTKITYSSRSLLDVAHLRDTVNLGANLDSHAPPSFTLLPKKFPIVAFSLQGHGVMFTIR